MFAISACLKSIVVNDTLFDEMEIVLFCTDRTKVPEIFVYD